MTSFKDYDLVLPQLTEEDDTLQAIINQGGIIKESAIVLAQGFNLLKDIDESKATPERVGWLNLWSKSIVAMKSAISAFETDSDLSLQAISRASFEWLWHAMIINDPISETYRNINQGANVYPLERSNRLTVDRLRAYTAWCLWADKLFYRKIIRPDNLNEIWNPEPAKSIVENEDDLERHEKIFGKIEIEVDEEQLKAQRRQMKSAYQEKIDKIDQLLLEPHLQNWNNKIQQMILKSKTTPPFFKLFNSSIYKTLEKHDVSFGYSAYSVGSMALHGSTMDQFIHIGDSIIGPKISHIR